MNEARMLSKLDGKIDTQNKLVATIRNLKEAINQFGPASISISFNGGKDCTLLLYIYHQLLLDINHNDSIRALYISSVASFQKVETFIHQCEAEYTLDLMTIVSNLKEGLRVFLNSNPGQKAILIGTRRSDPHSSNLLASQETDGDWPRIIRLHPILEFTYTQVWDILRALQINYCVLYDEGYTSLGGIGDTEPNPALKTIDGYSAAYLLQDGSLERNGRNTKN